MDFYDNGATPYAFTEHAVGILGVGVNQDSFDRQWSNAWGPLYGPGQSAGADWIPNVPWAGLNKRDLITQSPVVPVSHDPTVNSLQGNGAYLHGVITLQDLTNVAAETNSSSYNPG